VEVRGVWVGVEGPHRQPHQQQARRVRGEGGDSHQQARGVVRDERAGGPAGGVGAPRQGTGGFHATFSPEGTVGVRGVRARVGGRHLQPH